MKSVRVLLVDDQRLMREGLRTLLDLEPDIEVVGEAGNGAEGVAAYLALRPDVALMDVRMPEMDGVEATRRIVAADSYARVIILTTFDDDEYVLDGLRAGALGYLLKDVGVAELADAIHTVMRGGVLIEPSVARKVVAELARLRPAAPGAGVPGRAAVGARARNPPAGCSGAHQPRHRSAPVPRRGHGEELRDEHTWQDRCA